ncbi:hypothetical protein [Neglectibacter timonensis]
MMHPEKMINLPKARLTSGKTVLIIRFIDIKLFEKTRKDNSQI